MTCIIKKLFHSTATRNTKAVRAAAHAIVARANEYAAAVAGADGTDATREALTAAGFGWMYDATGKANKKGVAKKIMSPLSRKIKEGMTWLSDPENADVFLWEAGHDNATASLHDFANIKSALTKAVKDASPKIVADNASEGEGESEGEGATNGKRTPAEFLEWVYQQARKEFDMDSTAFAEFAESKEGMAIADKYARAA
jgi:hypothetical protein